MTERDHQKPMIVRLAEDFAEDCIKAGYVSTVLPSHAKLMEATLELIDRLEAAEKDAARLTFAW